MIKDRKIVGVMGSHEEAWGDFSKPLGGLIARKGCHLLTGCGGGVMTSVAQSFSYERTRSGFVIGIRPVENYAADVLDKEKFPNGYIEIPITVPLDNAAQADSMPYSRNLVNVMSSDALVVLPGSHGTKNEASLALMYDKPVILFGPDGAFDSFPEDTLYTDKIEGVEHFLAEVLGV